MASAEKLLPKMTAKGIDIASVAGGAMPSLTAADVAAALARSIGLSAAFA